jgi:nicotinamide mononucleotide transporter
MTSLEIIGFLLTIAGVIFASHQHVLTWIISIVSPIVYVFVFFNAKLYADVLLQFFFIALSVYGFYCWKIQKVQSENAVRKINNTEIIYSSILTIGLSFFFYYFLKRFTNSDVPFADAVLTSLSLIATWLTAKKFLENWWIWIIADLLYAILFLYKQLYITSVLYLLLAFLAIYGLLKWKKEVQRF